MALKNAFVKEVRRVRQMEKEGKQGALPTAGVRTRYVLRKLQLLPTQQPLPLKEGRVQTLTAWLILSGGVQGIMFEQVSCTRAVIGVPLQGSLHQQPHAGTAVVCDIFQRRRLFVDLATHLLS